MRRLGLAGLALVAGCFGGAGGSERPMLMFGDCSDGCTLPDHPLASGGARTTIEASGVFSAVRSSNPGIASFTLDPDKRDAIDVVTGHAGAVTIELIDARGAVVASAPISVEDTATLTMSQGWTTTSATPLLLEGAPFSLHVATLDARGRETRGEGAVAFTLAGTLAPSEIALGAGDGIGFAGAAGSGTITASAPATTLTQSFTIVPASAITMIEAVVDQTAPASGVAVVVIVPQSAAGPVYTDPCRWTTSDPSVTLQSTVGPELDLGPGELGIFNVTRPGTFTVTCSVAGQSASVTLTR